MVRPHHMDSYNCVSQWMVGFIKELVSFKTSWLLLIKDVSL